MIINKNKSGERWRNNCVNKIFGILTDEGIRSAVEMRRRHWKHTTRHAGDENRKTKQNNKKKEEANKKTGTRKPNRSIKYTTTTIKKVLGVERLEENCRLKKK